MDHVLTPHDAFALSVLALAQFRSERSGKKSESAKRLAAERLQDPFARAIGQSIINPDHAPHTVEREHANGYRKWAAQNNGLLP